LTKGDSCVYQANKALQSMGAELLRRVCEKMYGRAV
jgi:hypothetical protein